MDSIISKISKCCGRELEISLFMKGKNECRDCHNRRARNSYHNNKKKNKQVYKERFRKYYLKNKEKVNFRSAARRLAAKTQGFFTRKEWRLLCDYYGNKCARCGKEDITVDHVIPVSKGGSNNIENLQPLCTSCNCGKNNKYVDYRFDGGLFAEKLQKERNLQP